MSSSFENPTPTAFSVFEKNTMIALPLIAGCLGAVIALLVLATSGFSIISRGQFGLLLGVSLLGTVGGILILALRVRVVKRVFRTGVSVPGKITRITPNGRRKLFGIQLNQNVLRWCVFEYDWNGARYRRRSAFESRILDREISAGDRVTVVVDPRRPRSAFLKSLYLPDSAEI